jgi:hypothetical protein
MRVGFSWIAVVLFAGAGVPVLPSCAIAQATSSGPIAVAELPEAPQAQQAPAGQSQATPQPASNTTSSQVGPAQGSSSSQSAAQQPGDKKSKYQKAEEQIKEEEHQRNIGILPAFNVSYRSDAVSLTAGQKMRLAFRSVIDPVTFGGAFLVAGYHEGMHDDVGFPWGIKGYGERSGAAYLDAFDGGMIGNGILPSILHQDPRYFRLGQGTTTHRLLYAVATSFICKHDNTGKWKPNYSNVTGNIISGAISNYYYPPSGSGIGQTFTNGMIVTAEGGIGSIFQEFWPDISRKLLHKDPTHGLDAQARAADRTKKESRKQQE